MLLNLSNHPFESWSEKQVLAAKSSYGEIINLPFPPVDPVATSEEVAQLALQYKDIIKNLCVGNASPTIHLMGEMTFSFLLASLLLKEGINVVCSTTKRIAQEDGFGKKVSQFEFVQFREYLIP